MALASVSATRFFECIFGTSPKKGATPRRREPSAQHHRFMAARQKLSLILTALPRDPGFNRGRAKSLRGANVSGNQEGNVYPSVKIKIVSSLSLVDKNDDLPPIVFSHQDYANLDGLVRCFFGKPGRMNACGRCQVSRRSMLACRVQRGHLNQDFNWDDIMTGVGGIEGLLYTLRYGNPPPPSSSEAQPQAVHVSEEPPSDLASKSEASLQHDAAKAEEDAAKDTQALRLLASASRALLLAETLLASTKKAAELPPRLSDEFIRNSFPIDPADGHYNYCSICGLSGDVICCEMPVVMHAPCAGSDRVPEGDWFCSKCNASDTKESKLDEKTEVPGQMKAVMIPLDDARARSGELCKKGSQAFSVNDSTQGEEDAATGFGGKTGISGEARKGKGPEDTASDALNQTLDNDDKKILNLPLEDMQSELDTLLCELRDYRLAQNPARNRKKDDKKEEQQDKITENVANEKESVHDREQETNEDNVIAGKMSTTTMLRRTSVIASERSDEEHPQVSEKGDEPQAIGIGSKVSKDFGENGRFLGVVKALPCEDYPFYKIRYEDGDEEDMDEGELEKFSYSLNHRGRGRLSIVMRRLLASEKDFNSRWFSGLFSCEKKGKWRDKIGTIVKEVSKFTWEVKFDDGIDRGTFKSLQLTFADAGASSQVETAVEDNDDDNHTRSSNRGQSVEFKAGVRVVPKKNIYKFKGATIVRSAGRHKWELKFDDGVDRGLFKTQQLCVLDDNQILPSLDVDTADGVKKEFKVGVRVLPKKRVYQGKLATIIRSCGNHTWELKFDDGVDRGTFTSQQLAYIADSERDAVASSANAHMDFKAGVRVVSKSRIYEGNSAQSSSQLVQNSGLCSSTTVKSLLH
ncbi:TPL-binding domain in jasmonate signaling [Fragilaria crotonensis]|nr:TPL-binding domain in jasmonate signaling [Fragilaria crotonensis]